QQMDWPYVKTLLDNVNKQNTTISSGGSCANTIKGLANFGHKCALFGKMGNDEMGSKFLDIITKLGIIPICPISMSSSTQICLCFITPDGDRTMRCFQEAASNDIIVKDLSPKLFQNVSLVHIEGYSLFSKDLNYIPTAMQMAKK